MATSKSLRAVLVSAACGVLAPCAVAETGNTMGITITEPGQSVFSESVLLGVDKSTVIDLDRPAADVVITNAEIADAVVQSRKRIIFRGVTTGSTNAFVYDEEGNTILALEITVEADYTQLNALIERHVPEARVKVESVNGSAVLTGYTANVAQSEQVRRLVSLFAGGQTDIVSMVDIAAKDQVLL
ncbi:MAG: pilus assembly protein N-terminal domain-containing protein, partial [Pseudomonadota bacterium]